MSIEDAHTFALALHYTSEQTHEAKTEHHTSADGDHFKGFLLVHWEAFKRLMPPDVISVLGYNDHYTIDGAMEAQKKAICSEASTNSVKARPGCRSSCSANNPEPLPISESGLRKASVRCT